MEHPKLTETVSAGPEKVELMRRALNRAYSEVPSELNQVFDAALDQVADQQLKVAAALVRFLQTDNIIEAEQTINVAIAEAQRNALRAARAYADDQSEKATTVYDGLTHIPANVTDLSDQKRKLDSKFARAVKAHEEDNVSALEPLLEVAGEFKSWSADAQARIIECQGIVASDRRKDMLQIVAIIVAVLIGVINLILYFRTNK